MKHIGPGTGREGEVTAEFQISVLSSGRIYWEKNLKDVHTFIGKYEYCFTFVFGRCQVSRFSCPIGKGFRNKYRLETVIGAQRPSEI